MNLIYFLAILHLVFAADDDGSYNPGKYGNDGQYSGGDDGQYHPDDDGKYRPGDEGRYSGQADGIGGGGSGTGRSGAGRERDGGTGNRRERPVVYISEATSPKSVIASAAPSPRPVVYASAAPAPRPLPTTRTPVVLVPTRNTPTSPSGPQLGDADPNIIQILRQENEIDVDGYRYLYETGNEILAEEAGNLQNLGTEDEALKVSGYYQYVGPDGVLYRVDYTVDEGGFQASGAHLPTPPPIPEAILRSLEYIAAEEAKRKQSP